MSAVFSEIVCQVVARDSQVVLLFSRPVDGSLRPADTNHFNMDAQAAVSVAEALTNVAFEIDEGLKPVGSALKASLVDKHRQRLLPRLTQMLNSQRELKTVGNQKLAQQMLDVFCAEVFS